MGWQAVEEEPAEDTEKQKSVERHILTTEEGGRLQEQWSSAKMMFEKWSPGEGR